MKKIFPHIFVLGAFLCLISLGTWQVQRRAEKEQILTKINANINTPAITPSQYADIQTDEYKRMNVSGKYLYDHEFLLLNKPFNGKPGQHIMTPLKADNGAVILVNRGWAPTDTAYEKPAGEVTISAIIRAGQKLNTMAKLIILDNEPQKKVWFWLDLPAIYKNIGAAPEDYYLDLVNNTKSTSYPFALNQKIEVYNEHLVYIITWYSLALVLLLVYYFRFWKK